MESLFPALPDNLTEVPEEELAKLLADHTAAVELINNDDAEFLGERSASEIIIELEKGVAQIKELKAEQAARAEAHDAFQAKKAELTSELEVKAEEEEEPAAESDDDPGDDNGEEEEENGEEQSEPVEAAEEKVPVLASTANEAPSGSNSAGIISQVRFSRTPPAPAPDRVPVVQEKAGASLVAAGELAHQYPSDLTPDSLANMVLTAARHWGTMPKIDPEGKYRFGGPEHRIAHAEFDFPADRTLEGNWEADQQKIEAVIVETVPGVVRGQHSLTASGGLCAPLEPIYSMPNFATTAEPVWDALPTFRAARGGVNTPEATIIGDITTAISSISEADDALGGTFATKSCQDLECPEYTEVAVQILAHCREYGNLNARAWPEKIRHENELTMAALSRTSEGFLLDRIKALSINVTNGAETLGALIYLVDAIVKARFGIIGRLRMPRNAMFRALIPYWVPAMLVLDTIQTQFDRFRSEESLVAYLREQNIEPVFYLDTPSSGTTQLPDAAQTAAALDPLPDNVQWAIYPEGAFLGIDSGTLELGVVRDSTLNSTNDFQVFGERFRNVARIGPAQSAYWVTSDLCAIGQFPPAGTARTCD